TFLICARQQPPSEPHASAHRSRVPFSPNSKPRRSLTQPKPHAEALPIPPPEAPRAEALSIPPPEAHATPDSSLSRSPTPNPIPTPTWAHPPEPSLAHRTRLATPTLAAEVKAPPGAARDPRLRGASRRGRGLDRSENVGTLPRA